MDGKVEASPSLNCPEGLLRARARTCTSTNTHTHTHARILFIDLIAVLIRPIRQFLCISSSIHYFSALTELYYCALTCPHFSTDTRERLCLHSTLTIMKTVILQARCDSVRFMRPILNGEAEQEGNGRQAINHASRVAMEREF